MLQAPWLLRSSGIVWLRQYVNGWLEAWHRFWFEPADPLMLGIIRLLGGWMLFYNLAIWTLDLEAFFGDNGLQPLQAVKALYVNRPIFSFWLWTGDQYLWPMHIACLVVSGMFCLGFATRVTSILSFLITISYSQRVPIANFGFDQILGMLCLYLSIGPSGAAVSVDSLIRRWWLRRKGQVYGPRKFASARVSMRLIQLHLCAIYFWAGFAKLKGPSWWTGEAMWRVIANEEYQTMDLTWMAWVPWLPFLIAHVAIAWEIFFIVLVWNPKFRPLILFIGVLMHLGIGAFLGMWTFGLIMAFAYLAFSDPDLWRHRMALFVRWMRDRGDGALAPAFEAANVGSGVRVEDAVECVVPTMISEAAGLPQSQATAAMTTSGVLNHTSTPSEVCVVAAVANDRSTLRRYLREHQVPCRIVSDLNSGLDVVSRYRISAVVINTTQLVPASVVDFAADVADLTNLPILVLSAASQQRQFAGLDAVPRVAMLELPASLREIRCRLQSICDAVESSSPRA
jgi:Vitamin K-dependent gamma-carboxylase